MTLGSGGISPQMNSNMSHAPGMGDLGASEGRGDENLIGAVDEEEFDKMFESGEIERDFEREDLEEPADVEIRDVDRGQEDEEEQNKKVGF